MSQRTKVPQCPLSPWCCISRSMLCNCSGFFFVAGGKKKELTELGAALSVPGFSKPRPPLPSCDCHTACVGTGRSFSLWCETWQKGMATTQLSPPLLLCLIYTSGIWVSEERCWKQMFSIWICRAYQLCVMVRLTCSENCSHLRMHRVLEGVSMLLG